MNAGSRHEKYLIYVTRNAYRTLVGKSLEFVCSP
jgi:hypothetical protein